jgi:hypothetical protein
MPRNGSGVYSHPFPDVVEGTTIESAVFNGNTSDVEQDLNLPRPIVAGGTGATNAHDALIALHGEESGQLVDNYDSFPFVAGSFRSLPGATGAPDAGHYFAGICYVFDANAITLEASIQGDAALTTKFIRNKATTWGPWKQQPGSTADLDAAYVNVAGDTMTGNLRILTAAPTLQLDKTAEPSSATLAGTKNNSLRWQIEMGNGIPESGSNTGSNLTINRFNDAGAFLGTCFSLDRNSGDMHANNSMSVTGTSAFGSSVTVSAGLLDNQSGILKIGKMGTPVGALIDFRSSGAADFDVRLQSAGGTATNGAGNLSINAAQTAFNGTAHFTMAGGQPAGAYYDSVGGASRFFAGCDSAADVWRIYSVGAGNAFTMGYGGAITMSGALTVQGTISTPQGSAAHIICGSSDGLECAVAAGGNARFKSTVGGVRTWALGCVSSGEFYFSDETAPAVRLIVNTAGVFNFQGNTVNTGNLNGTAVTASYGYQTRQGISVGGFGAPFFNLFYSGGQTLIYMDNVLAGVVAAASDYRIKKDVIDLPGMWDTAKALRPIKYTHQQFSPPSHVKHVADQIKAAKEEAAANPDATPREVSTAPFIEADDIERWGFVAHELQELLIPSAASGVKDDPGAIQSPNPWTVIAVLTKALQEAMARIEALEGGAARR